MGPTLGINFCHGFYLSLNERWLKHLAHSDVEALSLQLCLLIGSFIACDGSKYKMNIYGGTSGKDYCWKGKDSTINKNNLKYKTLTMNSKLIMPLILSLRYATWSTFETILEALKDKSKYMQLS